MTDSDVTRLGAGLDHPLHRVVVGELADVTAAVLDDVDLVAVVDRLHGRKRDARLRPEARQHDLRSTGGFDRGHEVLVVPRVHGRPFDGRLRRKHRLKLGPEIPGKAVRLYRREHDRYLEDAGGLGEGDGIVDDRLTIEIRDAEKHLRLMVDERDDAIVLSQETFFTALGMAIGGRHGPSPFPGC